MHGGAEGSGAPAGNTNALKHGAYTKETLARRAVMRSLLREARKLLRELCYGHNWRSWPNSRERALT